MELRGGQLCFASRLEGVANCFMISYERTEATAIFSNRSRGAMAAATVRHNSDSFTSTVVISHLTSTSSYCKLCADF